MHDKDISPWIPPHDFHAASAAGERGTRLVAWITVATMVVEILAGWWFNSMTLLADGWHMSSHAFAIGLSAFAYAAARRHARDPRFAFGTWKIEVLGGFTSALFLLGVAAMMVFGSVERLVAPAAIHYREAMVVAVVGLVVNLVCALILGQASGHDHGAHGHDHGHPHAHDDPGQDLNLKSAYLHVITDAATSLLAILALAGGWLYGWDWLDPAIGIVGALLVGRWASGLLAETSAVLLDREMDHPVVDRICQAVETGPEAGSTRVADLHVWRVGRKVFCCAISLVTHDPALTPAAVRRQLAVHQEIAHSTVEIQLCPDAPPPGGEG